MKFKLGNRVRGAPDWCWGKQGQDSNGNRVSGVITELRYDDELFPYRVEWQNGHKNVYRDNDLIPARDGPLDLNKWS